MKRIVLVLTAVLLLGGWTWPATLVLSPDDPISKPGQSHDPHQTPPPGINLRGPQGKPALPKLPKASLQGHHGKIGGGKRR